MAVDQVVGDASTCFIYNYYTGSTYNADMTVGLVPDIAEEVWLPKDFEDC